MIQSADIKVFKVVILLSFACCGLVAQAQKKSRRQRSAANDTLAQIREFIDVSGNYKKVPMFLDMEIINATNFIRSEEDTSNVHALFYIGNKQAYVNAGEFEQIVNDTSALLISNRLHKMIFYQHADAIIKKMKSMMSPGMNMATIAEFSKKYSALNPQERGQVKLASRELLPGSVLAREVVELNYDIDTHLPREVTVTRRTLIRLDSSQYQLMRDKPEWQNGLVKLQEKDYLVKEQQTKYIYKKIDTDESNVVPVAINDRILRNSKGEYLPVNAYAAYRLQNSNW